MKDYKNKICNRVKVQILTMQIPKVRRVKRMKKKNYQTTI